MLPRFVQVAGLLRLCLAMLPVNRPQGGSTMEQQARRQYVPPARPAVISTMGGAQATSANPNFEDAPSQYGSV